MRRALVCGGGGFIGHHLVRRLRGEGFWVRCVDLKLPEYSPSEADDFVLGDLRKPALCARVLDRRMDEVYQLAADMGGAGYLFTGEHDADVMHNSVLINLNVLRACVASQVGRVFFSSSACVYPAFNQLDRRNPLTAEDSAYPASPDSEYGWEKLFSERLYLAFARNHSLPVRIARLHNVFGPEGTWTGGREKAPAAICRKVAEAEKSGEIEIWGDGMQTRSFLYIDECLEGIRRLMHSDVAEPLNIGSAEMVTLDGLVGMVMKLAGKRLRIRHVSGPLGVMGRTSDNALIRRRLGWAPRESLLRGMRKTYPWIREQVERSRAVVESGASRTSGG